MTVPFTANSQRHGGRGRVAMATAVALLSAMFVVADTTPATAEPDTPLVTLEQPQTLVLGEDLAVEINVSSSSSATYVYNVSAAILLPADVAVVDTPFGDAKTYTAADGALPNSTNATCADYGLVQAAAPNQTSCAVPANMQLLVIENFSDLPAGASLQETLTVRPQVAAASTTGYDVGDSVPVSVYAYTSSDERLLPVFTGSTGVGNTAAKSATSYPGMAEHAAPVKALRITKSEPSPEEELLRGVHNNSTLYTLTVDHTGEGDLTDAKVVDFLPANLEFLGCGTVDNTTNANGNRGGGASSVEYDGASRLDVATPDVDSCIEPASVETVEATAADATSYGVTEGSVYTKVTWSIGSWLASSGGSAQQFPATAGVAGTTTIQYRAAVPLFENTLEFGYTPDTTGQQAANLDNNRGASTRHGDVETATDAAKLPETATNVATAFGTWQGVESSDTDTQTVEIVDVRVVKDVSMDSGSTWADRGSFVQGDIARYRLTLDTSEYVGAELSGPTSTITDTLGNGLCPVYPSGTDTPTFEWTTASGTEVASADEFNDLLEGVGLSECEWGTTVATSVLTGAMLSTLGFDITTGKFTQTFLLDPAAALAAPDSRHQIVYSVHQNASYITNGSEDGATSSGDTVPNNVDVEFLTTARSEVKDLTNSAGVSAGDTEYARENSEAMVEADYSAIEKSVLDHDQAGTGAAGLTALPETAWLDAETTPFAVGDKVWFKVSWTPSTQADIRNPVVTDFLPDGLKFDASLLDATNQWQDSSNLRVYAWNSDGSAIATGSGLPITLGECTISSASAGYSTFVGDVTVSDDGRKLTWELGDEDCFPSGNPSQASDRFFPTGYQLDFYIQATVVDAAAFGQVDLTQNLVKYQQENVDGEIFFLRDQADITLDTSARLVKGVEQINSGTTNAWNSNVDGDTAVQQDQVKFRLDVTAPVTTTTGYVILDALPDGVLAADLDGYNSSTHAFTASGSLSNGSGIATDKIDAWAYDWDASTSTWPGLPSSVSVNSAYNGRTIVVWHVNATIPGSGLEQTDSTGAVIVPAVERGFSLHYAVNVPDGGVTGGAAAQIGQRYENVASIAKFAYQNASGGQTTVVPSLDPDSTTAATGGSWSSTNTVVPVSNATAGTGEYAISADKTSDPSYFTVPLATIDKTMKSTQIAAANTTPVDANNPTDSFVEGETVTFEISVTLPAHTTVKGGVLKDDGWLTWTGNPNANSGRMSYGLVNTVASKGDQTLNSYEWGQLGFALNAGHLVFPDTYTTGATDETFTLTLTVRPEVKSLNLTQAQRDQLNGKSLTNTGRFSFTDPNTSNTTSLTDTATVKYRDPKPTLTKTASPTTVGANGTVTYTLTAGNTSGRPILYDVTVLDCVPAGISVTNPVSAGTGFVSTLISTNSCRIESDVIKTDSLGTNTGTLITWNLDQVKASYTSPETQPTLTYTGTVTSTAGAGSSYTNYSELSGYTLPSTIDPGHVNGGERTAKANETVSLSNATLTKSVDKTAAPVGDTVEYSVQVTLPANASFYDVTLTDTLPTGVTLVGTPAVTYTNWQDGDPTVTPTPTQSGSTLTWSFSANDISLYTADRTITITFDAKLTNTITDSVSTVTNDAKFTWNMVDGDETTKKTASDDADVDLLDPVLEIVKTVDDTTPEAYNSAANNTFGYTVTVKNTGTTPAYNMKFSDDVPAGVVVDPATISHGGTLTGTDANGAGGTITWNVAGPLSNVTGSNTLTFTYQAKLAPSSTIEDAETFTNVASVDHYESFPTGGRDYDPTNVNDDATIDPAFPNVTIAKSVSDATAYVGEPTTWTLTATNTGDGSAQTVTLTDTLPENWQYTATTSITVDGTPVTPATAPSISGTGNRTLTWTFGTDASASPILPAGKTIVIVFTATPLEAALSTAGVTTDAGVAVPHTNTVAVAATDPSGATGNESGSYAGPDATANAYLRSADLELTKSPGAGLIAGGAAATAWTIDVSNNGPDTAVGPITVTDTWGDAGQLPAGFTVTGVSGDNWTCQLTPAASADPTGFECTTTGPLASGSSLPAITVTAQAASSFDPDDSPVPNSATVAGKTFDPDTSNNTDDADVPVTATADLAVVKTVSTASPNAGSAITWQLAPTNNGPAVSRGTITITDTIPAGISGVTDPSTADWTATVTRSGSPSTWPATAGDVITWTYQGSSLAVGAAPTITLTGTIDSAWTGDTITNTAVIHPGTTPDPATPNNTSDVPVTPGDATTLAVTKTRVVWDAATSTWVSADPAANPFVWGQQLSYLVTVVNNGPADARDVTVVDETPGGLAFASVTDVSGTWTHTAGGATTTSGGATVAQWDTFTLTGTQPVGASRSFVITYNTDPSGVPSSTLGVDNWVEASADNATNTPRDDDDTTSSGRVADLKIEKTHTGQAVAGGTLDYQITATNLGPSVSDGPITITDTLPAGFSYGAGSAQVSIDGATAVQLEPTVDGQTLTWTLLPTTGQSLAPNATIVIDLTTTIAANTPAQTDLVNRATVDAPNDGNPTNNTAHDPTTVVTEATMSIDKTVAAGPWIAGTEVQYTLTVTNSGPSEAPASVTDTLPQGLTLVSVSGSGWECPDNDAVAGAITATCTYTANAGLHPVGAANASTLTVVAAISSTVPTGTELENTALLTWTDSRGSHTDDHTADITVTTSADMALVKKVQDADSNWVDSAEVTAGTAATFQLTASNVGPSNTVGPVTVTDTLPDGLTFQALTTESSAAWTAAVDADNPRMVTFTLQPNTAGVAAGAAAPVIEFTALVDANLPVTASPDVPALTNTATVASGTPDPNPDNNRDSADVVVERIVNLALTKTHAADAVRIGDPLAFTLTVSNNGPSAATGVTITDVVPAGLDVTTAAGDTVGDGWTVTLVEPVDSADASKGTRVTATYGPELAAGASTTALTVTTTVGAAAYPGVTNVADVTGTEPDTDGSNNHAEDPVTVPPLSLLEVTKTAKGTFQVGKTAMYAITVTNSGLTADPGPVTVTDALPAGLTYVDTTLLPDGVSVAVDGQTVTWTLAEGLAVGQSVEIGLKVRVGAAAYPSVTNTAVVESPSEQMPSTGGGTDSVTVPVRAAEPLSVTGADPRAAIGGAALLILMGAALVGVATGRRKRR